MNQKTDAARRSSGLGALMTSIFLVDLANTMAIVALPLLLIQEFGATLAAGLTFALRLLPGIVAGPIAGGVLARRSPNAVAFVSTLFIMLFCGLLAFAHTLWQIQLLSLAMGTAAMFAKPARLVLRPAVIREGDEMRGNGFLVAAQRVATLIAPPVVGVMLIVSDLRIVFAVAAAAFFVSSLAILSVPRFETPSVDAEEDAGSGRRLRRFWVSYARNTRGLLQVTAGDSFMRGATLTAFTYVLAVALGRMFLLVIGDATFADVPGFYGWMLAVMGAGGICGSLLAGRVKRVHPGTLYIVAMVGEAAIWASFVWIDSFFVALGLMLFVGILESAGYVVYYAQAQERIPQKLTGYYYAAIVPVTDAFTFLGTAVGAALAGWSANVAGIVVMVTMALPVLLTARWYYPDDLRDERGTETLQRSRA